LSAPAGPLVSVVLEDEMHFSGELTDLCVIARLDRPIR
jgi:hypothetical protein